MLLLVLPLKAKRLEVEMNELITQVNKLVGVMDACGGESLLTSSSRFHIELMPGKIKGFGAL